MRCCSTLSRRLIPMFIIIGVWGGRTVYAAVKFFYTLSAC
jgi:NADH:ubiquinone oxidoreductase subunit 4 (subunit M)